ncbi:MAG TPA: winged helix-turn-helix domain-containing protein [Candidatus Acidoferrum sp.]|nr:winged helix-turn-helix domain-containing protein [Candidatus Acidoferrum sp.]
MGRSRIPGKEACSIPELTQPNGGVRFGVFEANVTSGELRKHGIRIKLHEQPFQILAMLVARPGEMVTREEIQQKLWPSGTFVDFENGMNRAVNRLRAALGDSADEPKFIETVPRRGYRFIALVERLDGRTAAVTQARSELHVPGSKGWRWFAGAAAAAVLLAAAFGGWRLSHPPKKTLNFSGQDWVLISSFENRTGNPVLDGTLEYALERELSNSQFVNIVPRERAGDALRLMRKSLDTRIDAALGREICLRDGGIRALLTGRVEKLGTTYVLSAELVDPVRGVSVASMSEEDPADSQVAAAVRRLSNRVRETLGETRALVQQSDKQLEKVTTPSLHALQLYSQADALMREDKQAPAAELLRLALDDDPNFASAHLLLGFTYANGGSEGKARPEFQRALELTGTTPDRERLFIQASYFHLQKETQRAIETYEALLRLYPDHFWAANNLNALYEETGRWDDRLKLSVRFADLRPDDEDAMRGAACAAYVTKNLEAAMPYIQRVRALAAADPKGPFTDTAVEMLPVIDSWSQGDVTRARSQFMQLEKSNKDFYYPAFLWSLGELTEAGKRLKADTDIEERDILLGMGSYIKGDWAAARKLFQNTKFKPSGVSTPMVLMSRFGLRDRVEAAIRKTQRNPSIEVVRGELAIASGQTRKGIALLEKGLEEMHTLRVGAFYLGSEALAQAYEKQGNFEAALRVLQRAADPEAKDCPCVALTTGHWWLRNELQLADLYRKMGRVPEAEKVEDELRKMLIYADADHPILRELQKPERLSAAATVKQ